MPFFFLLLGSLFNAPGLEGLEMLRYGGIAAAACDLPDGGRPWNAPSGIACHKLASALAAGCPVLFKPSEWAQGSAQVIAGALKDILPAGVFQYLHLDHEHAVTLVKHNAVRFVSFTGSVNGGKAIELATAGLFKGVALELGGKDPAYVMADADLDYTVANLVDGVYFNSGQSCCGVERIYVHTSLYDEFVARFVDTVRQYRLGNPLEADITLGPMVNDTAAAFVREQIRQAVASGARACIDPRSFAADEPGSNYLAPQVLVDVHHDMAVMQQESFGPVVGIMQVCDDTQAVELMNDSAFGLTASLWTRDDRTAAGLGGRLQTGTVYMNRCDYLDPALVWTGVKDSGRGYALSSLGYRQLTRPKSFHLRTAI